MTIATPPNRSFAGALSVQMRVIVALVLRELVMEFGQSRMAIFWMLFRPAVLVGLLYGVYSLNHHLTPQGMPLMAFLVSGWAAYFHFMRSMADTSGSVKGGSGLLMFPQMTALDVFLAQTVTEWFIYSFVFLLFASPCSICMLL
jgi:capsular polysaccharide transport system permease protein